MCDDEWLQFCNNEYNDDDDDNNTQDCDSSKMNENRNELPICPKAEELYISTKSKIGYLSKEVNLSDVFWKIPILDYHINKEGVIKKQIKLTLQEEDDIDSKLKQYGNYHVEDISKKKSKQIKKISIGTCSKDLISYRSKKKGAFYNCFVIIFRIMYRGSFKEMHVKIFNTGKMEIPGVPRDDLLSELLTKIVKLLNSPKMDLGISIKENSFETVLINSNFNCGFNIKREILVDIIKNNYKLCVSYDPCSYPGIMCKYYYYTNKTKEQQDGRLYKNEEESIKPMCISFMIFRTGSVLIVGKCNSNDIIYGIYDFIKDILVQNYESIYASSIIPEAKGNPIKKKIKKKKIIEYAS